MSAIPYKRSNKLTESNTDLMVLKYLIILTLDGEAEISAFSVSAIKLTKPFFVDSG
jgi:hypothetical protein